MSVHNSESRPGSVNPESRKDVSINYFNQIGEVKDQLECKTVQKDVDMTFQNKSTRVSQVRESRDESDLTFAPQCSAFNVEVKVSEKSRNLTTKACMN